MEPDKSPDFSGYATKNDVVCTDGRVIKANAFKHNDGGQVPLVWQHLHNSPGNVLGHAVLENRPDGVYARGFFNNSKAANETKELLRNKDVNALSIYANQLVQHGSDVHHGSITELSIVLAGANSGAKIDNVTLQHGEFSTELEHEVIINSGIVLEHTALNEGDTVADEVKTESAESKEAAEAKRVYETMNEEQKNLLKFTVAALQDDEDGDEDPEEDPAPAAKTEDVAHSSTETNTDVLAHAVTKQEETIVTRIFENQGDIVSPENTLSHAAISTIVRDAKSRFGGSIKESFLAHAETYGIKDINMLFPNSKTLTNTPEFLKRRTEWVSVVLTGVNHAPFARIKTVFADITAEEARAKGYVTGNLKKDEVIELLKRETTPTTIYKKQKLDRDDVVDITDLDVIVYIKGEMRLMLDEEVARCILIGDGRPAGHEDKVRDPMGATSGAGIRSIANDSDFYAHQISLAANISTENVIEELIRARPMYKGSGNPVFFTTDTFISDMLLLKDKIGRRLYDTDAELARLLRVSKIIAVEAMESQPHLFGIMVNLNDYTVGTDRGGEINMFDDFDIDYNQLKYLIETRLSGALTKPKSAVVIKRIIGTAVVPDGPSLDGPTNTITIPTKTGIIYTIEGEPKTGAVVITEDTEVVAQAAPNYYIPANTTKNWVFGYTPGE